MKRALLFLVLLAVYAAAANVTEDVTVEANFSQPSVQVEEYSSSYVPAARANESVAVIESVRVLEIVDSPTVTHDIAPENVSNVSIPELNETIEIDESESVLEVNLSSWINNNTELAREVVPEIVPEIIVPELPTSFGPIPQEIEINSSLVREPVNLSVPTQEIPSQIINTTVNFGALVRDAKGNVVDATITVKDQSGEVVAKDLLGARTLAQELSIPNGSVDVEIEFAQGPVWRVTLDDANLSESQGFIRVDDTPEAASWTNLYAIDPSQVEFTQGTLQAIAKGNALYKCKDWNFDLRTCEGNWTLLKGIVPGTVYEVELSPADPAFGEIIATAAIHLDENGTVLENIYPAVSAIDNIWSSPIPANHSVRVSFEKNLTDGNVIDFLARDNGTVSYVEVYVANTSILVGRSGIAGIAEIQYVELSGVPSPNDVFDLKVVKQYHNLSREVCDENNPDCADSSIAENQKAGFLEFDFIHDSQVTNLGADGLIAYVENGVTAPRYRFLNNSNTSMSGELTDTQSPSTTSAWTVLKANHERNEVVMMSLDSNTNTSAQVYNGSAWGNLQILSTDVANTAQRPIDFAIEDVSGDVLFVYENVGSADTTLAYRTWNGSAYGSEQILTHGVSSPVRWVKTVSQSGTDNIMILFEYTSTDLTGVLWNGTAFVSSTMINMTSTLPSVTSKMFDFTWEHVSGEGFAVYANSGVPSTFVYRKFYPSNNSWSSQATFFTLNGGGADGLRLCADPISNYVGAVTQDGTNDANFWVWNGTALETTPARPTEDSDAEPNGAGALNLGCAFMKNGTAIFGYVPNPVGPDQTVRYCLYNKTAWSAAALSSCTGSINLSASAGSLEGFDFYPHPVTNEIMVTGFNVDEDLEIARWDGTGSTNRTVLETSLDCLNGVTQCSMFTWDQYDAVPNATIIVPSNNTEFTNGSQVNITVNVSDNVAWKDVNVTVTAPNGTTQTINASNISGNFQQALQQMLFNATTTIGRYNFTVATKDNSTHANTNNISGFFNMVSENVTSVVTLTKLDFPDPVIRGTTLRYEIVINNTGSDQIVNLTVVDTYASGVTFNSSQPSPSSPNGTFTLSDLSANSSFIINVTVNVSSGIANGSVLNNSVNLTYTNNSGSQMLNASAFTVVRGAPGIVTFKVDSPDPVTRGDVLRYSITVNNSGDDVAFNVTVVDVYPANVTFNGSQPVANVANGTFIIGDLSPNETFMINITVNVSSSIANGSVLNNSYNVTFANVSGETATVVNSTLTTVIEVLLLTVVKSDLSDPIVRGDVLNYTINVTNIGNSVAYNVTLVDTFPSNVTFVSAVPAPSSGNTTFDLGNITANSSTLVNIQVNVSPLLANATLLNNTVNVTFTNGSGGNSSVTDFEESTVLVDSSPTVDLFAPANNVNTTNTTVIFLFNVSDDISARLNCTLHINGGNNGTNVTTFNNTVTNITVGNLGQGTYQWNVTCSDLSINNVTSQNRTIRVDRAPPDFNSLVITTDTADALDPGSRVNFTLNSTDNVTSVDVMVLHILLQGAPLVNIMLSPNSTDLFNASFTPSAAGNYSFFFTGNDTVGNNDTSSMVNRTIDFESSWTRSPSSLGSVTLDASQSGNLGVITINNTGDLNLTFNLLSTFENTTFNESSFTIAPNSTNLVQVNVTAPSARSVTSLNITINASSGNASYPASPSFNLTTGTIVVTSDAFLSASFTIVPSSVAQGESGVTLEAIVNNTGLQNATNVTLSIVLPSDWTVTGGSLSDMFAEIAPNQTESISVTVAIASDAVTGYRNVVALADGLNLTGSNLTLLNFTQNTTEQVLVNGQIVVRAGGGGSGAGAGSGAGSGAGGGAGDGVAPGTFSKSVEHAVLVTNETIEVVRGSRIIFPLVVTNIYNNSLMKTTSLEVEGTLSRYVQWTPEVLENILFGRNKSFGVELAAPLYANRSEVEVTFAVTSELESTGIEYKEGVSFSEIFKKTVIEYKTVNVLIREISEREAQSQAVDVQGLYAQVVAKKYPTGKADILLELLRKALFEHNYEDASYISSKLKLLLQKELEAGSAIEALRERIAQAKDNWLDVSETEKILELAVNAFELEDFEKALARADEAVAVQFIELKGAFNLLRFVEKYWWAILLMVGVVGSGTYLGWKRLYVRYIAYRVEVLERERLNLQKAINDVQEQYFVKKIIGSGVFYDSMEKLMKKTESVRGTILRLRLRRAHVLGTKKALEIELDEKADLAEEMRKLQESYFVRGKISRKRYLSQSESLRLLEAEVDSQIASLKKRLKK